MPHPLKEYLGVEVCYKLVSEHGKNNCLAWAHERVTYKYYLITLRGNPLHYPLLSELLLKRGMKPSTIDRCFGNLHCMLLTFPNKESNFTLQ
jgi:hypothetical protein